FPAPFVLPSELRQAALTEQWVSLVNTVIDRTLVRTYLFAYIAPGTPDGRPNRTVIDAVMPTVTEQVAVLDKAVAPTGHLAAYYGRHAARPSFQRTDPPAGPPGRAKTG